MEVESRIPEKLFFRIGEVCELIKVQPHVLRYWETEFPMLAPQKNRAGQRVYRRKDVEMVLRIRDLLYEEKFTIAGAKKKLLEEARGGSSKTKAAPTEEPAASEASSPSEPAPNELHPDPAHNTASTAVEPSSRAPSSNAKKTQVKVSPDAASARKEAARDPAQTRTHDDSAQALAPAETLSETEASALRGAGQEPGSTALLPGLQPVNNSAPAASAQIKRALRLLKTDLEDLLTRLNSDDSIKR
ncbi:MAG TPA: MerR family transcriptional regulator [Blastocatellia bacterium]|nr:MerR family transcriptional regulator [Blastocatellia bacterium]